MGHYFPSRLHAVTDGTHDQRRHIAHVAGHKHALDAGHVTLVSGDETTGILRDAKSLDQPDTAGSDETHCDKYQVGIDRGFGTLDPARTDPSRGLVVGPLHLYT